MKKTIVNIVIASILATTLAGCNDKTAEQIKFDQQMELQRAQFAHEERLANIQAGNNQNGNSPQQQQSYNNDQGYTDQGYTEMQRSENTEPSNQSEADSGYSGLTLIAGMGAAALAGYGLTKVLGSNGQEQYQDASGKRYSKSQATEWINKAKAKTKYGYNKSKDYVNDKFKRVHNNGNYGNTMDSSGTSNNGVTTGNSYKSNTTKYGNSSSVGNPKTSSNTTMDGANSTNTGRSGGFKSLVSKEKAIIQAKSNVNKQSDLKARLSNKYQGKTYSSGKTITSTKRSTSHRSSRSSSKSRR